MQSKILILLLSLVCLPIAQAEEISVVNADSTWNLTLNDAAEVGRLTGETTVMVIKYADTSTYKSLEAASDVGRLVGEPDTMVVKYADVISYSSLEASSDVGRLVGESGVMVVKYADAIGYNPLVYNGSIGGNPVEIPVFPGYTSPPTDLDQDDLYEDINGNEILDFDDVVAYYDNMDWIEENVQTELFDYNNNGLIDFDDVVKLYDML
jgi:PKD repeat protein